MADTTGIKKLRLRQLDKRAARMRGLDAAPREGWVKQIRKALGMSARQLAAGIGISQSSLAEIEKNERSRAVSLKTLDRVATALDCRVVYAFLPRESFERLVLRHARRSAEKLVRRVSHSMELEKQGISAKKRQQQIDEIAADMARELSKQIWDDWK